VVRVFPCLVYALNIVVCVQPEREYFLFV